MEDAQLKDHKHSAILLIIGSLGVFLTSLSYLKCPPLLALPQLSLAPENYLQSSSEQLLWLKIASNIGVFSDLLLFIACAFYVLKIDKHFWLQFSWIWLAICSLIFFFVDAMLGNLLYPLVIDHNLQGLMISKYIFNLTFMLGVFCYAFGASTYFFVQLRDQKKHLILYSFGLITALLAWASFLTFLLGLNLPLVAGGSILLGSGIFLIIGLIHLKKQ